MQTPTSAQSTTPLAPAVPGDIGDRIVRTREARHIAGGPHRNTFHRMWKHGRFPAPVIDADGQYIWFASQLRQWLHELKQTQQQTAASIIVILAIAVFTWF